MQFQAIGADSFAGTNTFQHPSILQSLYALPLANNTLDQQLPIYKAKVSGGPDLPSLWESLIGTHAEGFWKAMGKEIDSIENMGIFSFTNMTEKILVLNYGANQIWLSPDNSLIRKYVTKLQKNYDLTLGPGGNICGFLCTEFNRLVGTCDIELT